MNIFDQKWPKTVKKDQKALKWSYTNGLIWRKRSQNRIPISKEEQKLIGYRFLQNCNKTSLKFDQKGSKIDNRQK